MYIWAVITFVITLTVLYIFVFIVLSYENKLEHQMSHDKLTELPNRYFYSNHIEELKKIKNCKTHGLQSQILMILNLLMIPMDTIAEIMSYLQ